MGFYQKVLMSVDEATAYRQQLIDQGSILPLEARPTLRLDVKGSYMALVHIREQEGAVREYMAGWLEFDPREQPWKQDPRVMP